MRAVCMSLLVGLLFTISGTLIGCHVINEQEMKIENPFDDDCRTDADGL